MVNLKDLILEDESSIFGVKLVGIKCIGNYSDFVDEKYIPSSGMYNLKEGWYKTNEEIYLEKLKEGKSLQINSYIVFMPGKGYENKYKNYVKKYLKEKNEEKLFNSLKDSTSYGMVKSLLKMIKEGTLPTSFGENKLKKYFKNEEELSLFI